MSLPPLQEIFLLGINVTEEPAFCVTVNAVLQVLSPSLYDIEISQLLLVLLQSLHVTLANIRPLAPLLVPFEKVILDIKLDDILVEMLLGGQSFVI